MGLLLCFEWPFWPEFGVGAPFVSFLFLCADLVFSSEQASEAEGLTKICVKVSIKLRMIVSIERMIALSSSMLKPIQCMQNHLQDL